jgi:hypothetical protein
VDEALKTAPYLTTNPGNDRTVPDILAYPGGIIPPDVRTKYAPDEQFDQTPLTNEEMRKYHDAMVFRHHAPVPAFPQNPPAASAEPESFIDGWLLLLKNFCVGLGLFMSPKAWKERMSIFTTLWKGSSDVTSFWRWILPVLITSVNTLSVKAFGRSIWVDDSIELEEMIRVDTNVLTTLNTEATAGVEPRTLLETFNGLAVRKGRMTLLGVKLDPEDVANTKLQEYSKKFDSTFKILRAKDAQVNPRVLPVCIFAPGKGGKGKTKLMEYLAGVLSATGHLRNPGISAVDNNRNFQDSFTDQATLILDEFCTVNSATGREADVRFVMKNVNTVPELVEKAAVDEKNLYWVENQLLLLTTNIELGEISGLLPDMTALHRRMHFRIDLNPPQKVNGLFPQLNGAIDWNQFSVNISQPDAANGYQFVTTHRDASIADLVVLIATKLNEHAMMHAAPPQQNIQALLTPAFLAALPAPVVPQRFEPVAVAREAIRTLPIPHSPGVELPIQRIDIEQFLLWISNPEELGTYPTSWQDLLMDYVQNRELPARPYLTEVVCHSNYERALFRVAIPFVDMLGTGPIDVDEYLKAIQMAPAQPLEAMKDTAMEHITTGVRSVASVLASFVSKHKPAMSAPSTLVNQAWTKTKSWFSSAKDAVINMMTPAFIRKAKLIGSILYGGFCFVVAMALAYTAVQAFNGAVYVRSLIVEKYNSWWNVGRSESHGSNRRARERYEEEQENYEFNYAFD